MKRKNFLIVNFINRKALIVAGLIALVFCLTFTSCELPEENDVTDITLNTTSINNINEGDVDYLYITAVQPVGATYTNVTWTSSDPSIIPNPVNGIIKPAVSSANKGSVTITAKTGTGVASCTIQNIGAAQTNKQVSGVTLKTKSLPMAIGNTFTLSSVVAPEDALNKDVFYVSSDPSVAKVDPESGTVRAMDLGTATITVYTKNKGRTDTCTVTVSGGSAPGLVPVTGVTLDKDTLILEVNTTADLTASVQPSNATNKTVTWDPGAGEILAVDGNGKVTALKTGKATVTVTTEEGEFEATCLVTVTSAGEQSVALNKTSLFLIKGGNAETLAATVAPVGSTVTWASSNTSIASIVAGGVGCGVSGVNGGTATITVTMDNYTNKTATCTVTVIDPTDPTLLYNSYSAIYGGITETVEIKKDQLRIFDDEKSGANMDFLDFSITKWELATTPEKYKSSYPIAFKITGKITGAKPDSPNLYGASTAPGFTTSDLNNTECWMYLYISNDGKLIRTAFSKASKNNGTVAVQENNNGTLRAYTKVTTP